MVSAEGDSIVTTCSSCHVILAQGHEVEQVNVNFEEGLEFIHPEDYETFDEFTNCTDCHDGGAELYE
jgi:hypothetical protein